jgi:TolB-like protein/tetratricopeptide (TPR) repeat protein
LTNTATVDHEPRAACNKPILRDSRLVLGVLRFTHDGEAGDEHLTDGLVEDVLNGIARCDACTVLSQNSSFAFGSDTCADFGAVAERLGASHLLEGVVRHDGPRMLIFVNLIEGQSSEPVWGDRYAVEAEGLFDAQRSIVTEVVGRIAPEVLAGCEGLATSRPAENIEAYLSALRGAALLRSGAPGDREQARTLFATAVVHDPRFGLAYSYLALAKLALAGFGAAPPLVLKEAAELAARGLLLAPNEPRCHRTLGQVRLYCRDHHGAESSVYRAHELNPCDAETLAQMAFLLTLRGRPAEALQWLDGAVRLNPIHPDWYHYDRALAFYAIGQYRAAAASLSRLPVLEPGARTRLAACHAQLGELDVASRHMALLRRLHPRFSPMNYVGKSLAFERAADAEHLSEGVMKALSAAA